MTLPAFQAQNPAISGYSLGWLSCTAFAAAMAASFDQQVPKIVTGAQVRQMTRDTTGGLTLAQVDKALLEGWGINLSTSYGLPWADFAKRINAGQGAILQGWYAPIADSRFDAGRGFRGNHAIFVAPSWIGMDPLADGRFGEAYKFHGEPYPQSLLRSFAGQLNLGDRRLGDGYVYASFTRDNVHTYALSFTGGSFWVYRVVNGVITSRYARKFSGPTSAPCLAPRLTSWPGKGSRSLARVTAGALKDQYVGVPQSNVQLRIIP